MMHSKWTSLKFFPLYSKTRLTNPFLTEYIKIRLLRTCSLILDLYFPFVSLMCCLFFTIAAYRKIVLSSKLKTFADGKTESRSNENLCL